jgi:hypothetical protein
MHETFHAVDFLLRRVRYLILMYARRKLEYFDFKIIRLRAVSSNLADRHALHRRRYWGPGLLGVACAGENEDGGPAEPTLRLDSRNI